MDGRREREFHEKIEAIYRLSRMYPVCYSFYDAWFNMMLHIPICNNRRVRIKESLLQKLWGEKIKTMAVVSHYKKVVRKRWTVQENIK